MDRNFYFSDKDADWVRSLSARRAWIEIAIANTVISCFMVALRKESVDRNVPGQNLINGIRRRSPQGERG